MTSWLRWVWEISLSHHFFSMLRIRTCFLKAIVKSAYDNNYIFLLSQSLAAFIDINASSTSISHDVAKLQFTVNCKRDPTISLTVSR